MGSSAVAYGEGDGVRRNPAYFVAGQDKTQNVSNKSCNLKSLAAVHHTHTHIFLIRRLTRFFALAKRILVEAGNGGV